MTTGHSTGDRQGATNEGAEPADGSPVDRLAEGVRAEAEARPGPGNGESAALKFSSEADLEKVLPLFWYDPRFRATPRTPVGDLTLIVPAEVVERLRQENIPFEV